MLNENTYIRPLDTPREKVGHSKVSRQTGPSMPTFVNLVSQNTSCTCNNTRNALNHFRAGRFTVCHARRRQHQAAVARKLTEKRCSNWSPNSKTDYCSSSGSCQPISDCLGGCLCTHMLSFQSQDLRQPPSHAHFKCSSAARRFRYCVGEVHEQTVSHVERNNKYILQRLLLFNGHAFLVCEAALLLSLTPLGRPRHQPPAPTLQLPMKWPHFLWATVHQ